MNINMYIKKFFGERVISEMIISMLYLVFSLIIIFWQHSYIIKIENEKNKLNKTNIQNLTLLKDSLKNEIINSRIKFSKGLDKIYLIERGQDLILKNQEKTLKNIQSIDNEINELFKKFNIKNKEK